MAKGSKPVTTTQETRVVLSPQQNQLLDFAMPQLAKFAANPPTVNPASAVAPFDPSQTAGQNLALGAASGAQTDLAQAGASAGEFLLGDVLFPDTNPALGRTIEASTQPIIDQLLQQALPRIRSEATSAGQFGGSRQGIAEGLATTGAARAVGDTAAKGA